MHEKSPSGIGLSGGLNSHLRQVYRKTFERFDREGRIDEAVFAPAELRRSGTIIGFAEDGN